MYSGVCTKCGKKFAKITAGNPCLCPVCEDLAKEAPAVVVEDQLHLPFDAPVKEVKEPNFVPAEEVFKKKVKHTPAVGTDGE